jgi:HSP20 family protein
MMREMGSLYPSLHFLSRFQAELDRLFKEVADIGERSLPAGTWLPPIDIIEVADAVVILVELPGIAAADLCLEVKGSQVFLSGNKSTDATGPTERQAAAIRFHGLERNRGRFEREIQLTGAVNTHLGKARLADGLLTVEFPKIAEQRRSARTLPIEEGEKTA